MNDQEFKNQLMGFFNEPAVAPSNEYTQILARVHQETRRLLVMPAVSCAFSMALAIWVVVMVQSPKQTVQKQSVVAMGFMTSEYDESLEPYRKLVESL